MSSATIACCSIIGLDCAYVRNRGDKQKKFEVIIGKSVPEERDNRFFGLARIIHHRSGKGDLLSIVQF